MREQIYLESWIDGHANQVAFCILASSFFLYIYYATGSYLNPDEAIHVVLANRESVYGAYEASHSIAHPPLMIIVLHFLLKLGKSVFILRLLSAVLSIAALWFVFKWIQRAFGSVEGIVGLMLLSFSPGMISIACEVRQYAMLLFFISGALYFVQRFVDEGSLWAGFVSSLFLYGAILTHYSAIWVALTFTIYVTTVFFWKKPNWRPSGLWLLSQIGVVILYGLLYVTHIRWYQDSGFAEAQVKGYLKGEYFSPDAEMMSSFIARSTMEVFTYIGGGAAGIIILACFFVGIIANVSNRFSCPPLKSKRHYLFLLVLPFIIGSVGAISRMLPFGGSRHISYLLPFVAAGIALCARVVTIKRFSLSLAAGMVLIPIWIFNWHPSNADSRMSDAHMRTALAQLNERVPANSLLLVDDMTHYVLAYYLARDRFQTHGQEQRMGKYHVVWANQFAFSPDNFEHELAAMSRPFNIKPGAFVWVMTVGWYSFDSFNSFLSKYPPERIKERWNFGPIILLQISVP